MNKINVTERKHNVAESGNTWVKYLKNVLENKVVCWLDVNTKIYIFTANENWSQISVSVSLILKNWHLDSPWKSQSGLATVNVPEGQSASETQ